jgi:hypothetical protein
VRELHAAHHRMLCLAVSSLQQLDADMLVVAHVLLLPPSCRIHLEPLSDILFSEHAVYTADHSGCVRTWRRPPGLHERPSDAMKHL